MLDAPKNSQRHEQWYKYFKECYKYLERWCAKPHSRIRSNNTYFCIMLDKKMKTVDELSIAESDAYFLFQYAMANDDMAWFRVLFLLQGASFVVINLIMSSATLQNNGEVVKTCLFLKPQIQTRPNVLLESFRLACDKNDKDIMRLLLQECPLLKSDTIAIHLSKHSNIDLLSFT